MHSLDRATAAEGMTPSMSDKLRLEYLQREIDAITELLDEEEECKWIYQALIEYSLILARMQGGMSAEIKAKVMTWLSNLKRLDPLRRGRWEDLETSMNERLD